MNIGHRDQWRRSNKRVRGASLHTFSTRVIVFFIPPPEHDSSCSIDKTVMGATPKARSLVSFALLAAVAGANYIKIPAGLEVTELTMRWLWQLMYRCCLLYIVPRLPCMTSMFMVQRCIPGWLYGWLLCITACSYRTRGPSIHNRDRCCSPDDGFSQVSC